MHSVNSTRSLMKKTTECYLTYSGSRAGPQSRETERTRREESLADQAPGSTDLGPIISKQIEGRNM